MSQHGQDLTSAAMTRAVEFLKAGKTADAEAVLVRADREAAEKHGPASHQAAVAADDLGNLYSYLGDVRRAVECFRRACAGPMPTEPQALRDRLTHLNNLGGALRQLGELDEAEAVLKQGADGRRAFYGTDHAGYGFGLEPLGELLLQMGRGEDALTVLGRAVRTFWATGHPRVASAVALQAEAYKLAGDPTPPFAGLESLPDDLLGEIGDTVSRRMAEADPAALRQVLADLLDLYEQRFGANHPRTLGVLVMQANHEANQGASGHHDVRIAAARRAFETCDHNGDEPNALQTLQGLALALGAAGRNDEAVAVYEQALSRAEAAGNWLAASNVLRNYGLLLADLERFPEAEDKLSRAVAAAEASGDAEMWGRAEVALGIFFQHRGRPAEARPLMESGLDHLDPAHPDTVYARGPLDALAEGRSCPCGITREALAVQLREHILRQFPDGLLQDVRIDLPENLDAQISVELSREPTEDELERVGILVNQAYLTFRTQMSRPR